MQPVCLFNKFGHCKYRETCNKLHNNEICEIESCEAKNCTKRHPKNCKFYDIYNRCKFGSFCSFSHVKSANNDKDMKSKPTTLENCVKVLENENKRYDVKLQSLAEKNEALEKKLESVVKSVTDVCEIMVKKSTDAVVDMILKRQTESEKKQNEMFDLINENLAKILVQSQPSCNSPAQLPSQPSSQPVSVTKFQCDVCGKTFGSSRALTNHDRKDHKP